jgi:retinol dehydrogenase 12
MPSLSLSDKIIAITGPTSGIGEVAARELAAMGAHLVLIARNAAKLDKTRQDILRLTPSARIDTFVADVSSQKQIREVAAAINARYPRLDVLLNNAGLVLGSKREVSEDGYELTFATNHLGPFLLTSLLFGLLEKSPAARIVNVSSAGHMGGSFRPEKLQLVKGYNPWIAYCNSKLFNIFFTNELQRRIKAKGLNITANALHPGAVRTGFGSQSGDFFTRFVFGIFGLFFITAEEGAQTSIYLASSPEVEGVGGQYFAKKKATPTRNRFITDENERILWQMSEEMTKTRFL